MTHHIRQGELTWETKYLIFLFEIPFDHLKYFLFISVKINELIQHSMELSKPGKKSKDLSSKSTRNLNVQVGITCS